MTIKQADLPSLKVKALEQLETNAKAAGLEMGKRHFSSNKLDNECWEHPQLSGVRLRLDRRGDYSNFRFHQTGWSIMIEGPTYNDRRVPYHQKEDGSFNWTGILKQLKDRIEKGLAEKEATDQAEGLKKTNRELSERINNAAAQMGVNPKCFRIEPSGSSNGYVNLSVHTAFCLDELSALGLLTALLRAQVKHEN